MLANVRSFIILQSGESLTSFNKVNSSNFSGEKKDQWSFRVSIFRAGEYANKLELKSRPRI